VERDSASGSGAGRATGALVSAWRTVFDTLYAGAIPSSHQPDFRGWTDPASGEPFPRDEMNAWLSATVFRIRSLQPRRVLEIGAGTGNLALALGPSVESYVATDVSALAAEALRDRAADAGLGQVVALQLEATEAVDAVLGDYDTVVINSVCQYFPDPDYAREVIAQSCNAVGPKGHVFVGDIRNAALGALEHATIEIGRRGERATAAGVTARLRRDSELALAPSFFRGLASGLGGRSAVPLLKPVSLDNVLSTFRYDVVISGATGDDVLDPRRVRWTPNLSADHLDRLGRSPIRITHISNPRISARALALAGTHATGDAPTGAQPPTGVGPEEWERAATRVGMRSYPVWDEDARDGSYCLIAVPTDTRDDRFDPAGTVRHALRGVDAPTES
jgi:SAM-dependent methyltransferase